MNKQEAVKILRNNVAEWGCAPADEYPIFTDELGHACNLAISALTQQLNDGWVPVSERLPNREEYCKNDGRFIVTDGSRVYQALFDIYDCKAFCNCGGKLWDLIIDTRPIAWQPLPSVWKGEING